MNQSGIIKAVCISAQKGTSKTNINEAEIITQHGIKNDSHAGEGHRQISLLPIEKIIEFQKKGAKVEFGSFGENLVVEGIDFSLLKIRQKLFCNDIILEITQIGKECKTPCRIFNQMGDCIMPREGIFTKVLTSSMLQGGKIKTGDTIYVE